MSDIKLTQTELAALDLLIQAMKSNVGGGQVPGGFINDIVNVVGKVIDVARQATPVVQVVTALVGAGGPSDPLNQELQSLVSQVPAGVTLDQLIDLRRRATVQR
jgi:hypothetical protein